jgi:hypothetical protein
MRTCWKTAGLFPWNPEMVIAKEEVTKRPITPPPPPIFLEPATPSKPQEVDAHLDRLRKDQSMSLMDKLKETETIARKANLAFARITIQLAKLSDEIRNLQREIDELVHEKPRERLKRTKRKKLVN